jgi:integrase
MEAEQIRGSYYDPKRGQTKFGVWADQWLKGATLRPKTRDLYNYLLHRFVKPTFADIALNDIDDTLAVDWLAELRELPDISEATIAKAYRLFARIMGAAVENRHIVHTSWKVKGAGRERSPEMRFATAAQVNRLAAAVQERYRALVLVAAYGELRWGELVNLRRRHVDAERGTVHVVEQVTELRGKLAVGPVKSEAGRRTVALPASVLPRSASTSNSGPNRASMGSSSPRPRAGSCGTATSAGASGSPPPRRPGSRASASMTYAIRRRPSPWSPARPPGS